MSNISNFVIEDVNAIMKLKNVRQENCANLKMIAESMAHVFYQILVKLRL